ncbi:MAG: PAS domain S-box protein [Sneathiella sp.]|nr:PAS domain S-box protein [Sneathiella sp.]
MKAIAENIQKIKNKSGTIGLNPKLADFDDLLSEWLWQTDKNGQFIFSNGRLEARLGEQSTFFVGRDVDVVLANLIVQVGRKNANQLDELSRLYSKELPVHDIEILFTDCQSIETQLYLSAQKILDKDGNFSGYAGVGRFEDIKTDEVTDTALLKTLMQAVENAPNGVLITDSNGIITYVNPSFTKITGNCAAESIGKTPRILSSGKKDKAFYKNFWATLKQGKSWHGTVQNKRKNGDLFWCREIISPVIGKDGTISNFIAIQQDVSDEVSATEALKLSEERFRGFADAASDWYWEMDEELRFSYVSEAACENAGMKREEMLGVRRSQLVTCEEDQENWNRHLQDLQDRKSFKDFCYSFVRGDGQIRYWEVSGKPYFNQTGEFLGYRGIGRDVTESRILEEQLHQSQKMEVVGHLTGGIAHDFNNLLAIILGNAEFLREMAENGEPAAKLMEKADNVIDAANRGANITKQLLMFSRKQPLLPMVLQLDEEIEKIRDMLQSSVGSAVEIKVNESEKLWQCRVDEDQLINAILNLAINARDAMNKSGTLRILANNIHFAKDDIARDISKGDYITLSLRDTGCGMPPQTLKKVFEPFFSTKEVGKGTGLGLSMVYGFAKKSGGAIWIDSEVGKGTNVQLFLPRYIVGDS